LWFILEKSAGLVLNTIWLGHCLLLLWNLLIKEVLLGDLVMISLSSLVLIVNISLLLNIPLIRIHKQRLALHVLTKSLLCLIIRELLLLELWLTSLYKALMLFVDWIYRIDDLLLFLLMLEFLWKVWGVLCLSDRVVWTNHHLSLLSFIILYFSIRLLIHVPKIFIKTLYNPL